MSEPPSALWTVRVGQLTGTTGDQWPDLVDAQHWPLLIDTRHWGMLGVDLGANTEHSDGRLYFFFGDTAELPPVPRNADLVAWTDDREILRHGGHQRLGWTFHLPSREAQHATEATGQGDWRFCSKCNGLFFAPRGSAAGTACPAGGAHDPLGWTFHLPSREAQHATEATGQGDWRFCANCHGLFFAPQGNAAGTACPTGGLHVPQGWTFFLPSEEAHHATEATGQGSWRFCANCHGLFYDGFPSKGVCPGARGGGIRLHAVLGADGNLDPFRAPEPFGVTESNETPTGAFSFGGTAYVFAGIGERRYTNKKRRDNPTYGNYLHSKARPDLPGEFHTEFLFSPRIGWCPTDATRTAFESHRVLGLRFVIQTGGESGPGWRACSRCDSMFWDAADQPSVCHKGGRHEPKATTFVLPDGAANGQHQNLWCRCRNCATLFFNGFDGQKGLCPAGGEHTADEVAVVVAHATFDEEADQQDHWRFCHKCAGLFREDWSVPSVCPAGDGHEAMGLEFVLPHHIPEDDHHQRQWHCCGKCGVMFWMGAHETSHCPAGGNHDPSTHPQSSQEFFLPHDLPADSTHQERWQFCTKCAGMFFNGRADFKGVCPKDGVHDGQGVNFVFAHNPGRDAFNEDGWRFCTRCFAMVDTKHPDVFAGAAACVVRNADHPNQLPQGVSEWGAVLLGFGWAPGPKPASRIAWMPLREGEPPRLTDTRYYSGDPENWSTGPEDAVAVLEHDGFTSVSLAWLPEPRRWICVYSRANDVNRFDGPAVARIGKAPWDWSPEIPIFDPYVQGAYGVYMHKVGGDPIHPRLPPSQDLSAGPEHDGWAYGAYLLNRFTEWDEAHRELTISYLLSLSSPYQPQLMQTRLHVPDEALHVSGTRHLALFHGGNGTTPVDSGLPLQGIFFGITSEGNLEWNRYNGQGESDADPASAQRWHPNTGNLIGRGWSAMKFLIGCGDGVIMAVDPEGRLLWYSYDGNGESDVSGSLGWHPNSSNQIGNGWQGFRHVFVCAQAGHATSVKVFGVEQNGDLRWYSYHGNGEQNPAGDLNWHPNSGSVIAGGWQGFTHVHGSSNVFFAIAEDGGLHWYSYGGQGEPDPSGTMGWHPNSGNQIGRGWQGMRHIFGGVSDLGGFGHVVMAVDGDGDLRWYRYTGQGEADETGTKGWDLRSSNRIGARW